MNRPKQHVCTAASDSLLHPATAPEALTAPGSLLEMQSLGLELRIRLRILRNILHAKSRFSRLFVTLCDLWTDCSLPGSSLHGDSPGKNTGVSRHALFQGIFPTQGLNPCLPAAPASQADSLLLSYQGSPEKIPGQFIYTGKFEVHFSG